MNWGHKILIVYATFIIAMLGMVYVASKQTNEMQDENYYVKELKYQDVIDGKNNLTALTDKVSVVDSDGLVKIKIPVETASEITDGTIYFMRPSDESKDVHLKLLTNTNGEQFISKTKFVKGLYTIQLSWQNKSKKYFSEQTIHIQ
ncbi:MAG: FixH family protein [Chitinophagales bacterium]|jgi:hypothetical protein|nr:FixH family protein [Saprospirales bacterium]MBP6660721.1 FixH family protein [Chitinophagales bacterium]